ncbi:Beauvericin cluster-specific repressor BEA4 [Paramyrothecium foliicola]|nr:Beauvericin cluster-specific repressor BEA4 [Paramyrothecium foliicola]
MLSIVPPSMSLEHSELDLRLSVECIEYYNAQIAPDLSPNGNKRRLFVVYIQSVAHLSGYLRYAYISIGATHRLVRHQSGGGPRLGSRYPRSINDWTVTGLSSTNVELAMRKYLLAGDWQCLFFCSQQAAVGSLLEALKEYNARPTDDLAFSILSGVVLILASQIQSSAYSSWATHLQGAWAFISIYGNPISFSNLHPYTKHQVYALMQVDIIGTSTSSMSQSDVFAILSRHESYAANLPGLAINAEDLMLPIPKRIMECIIELNMHRARQHVEMYKPADIDKIWSILNCLENFDTDTWVETIARRSTHNTLPNQYFNAAAFLRIPEKTLTVWRAITQAALGCTIIYAVSSLWGFTVGRSRSELLQHNFTQSISVLAKDAYVKALRAIQILFDSKDQQSSHPISPEYHTQTSGLLYKFALWPMMVLGTYAAVAERDKIVVDMLHSKLLEMGKELGTCSMYDGADFLASLWKRTNELSMPLPTWETIFRDNPLFMI